jgi:DNA-binding MarR family transcriptional regulator
MWNQAIEPERNEAPAKMNDPSATNEGAAVSVRLESRDLADAQRILAKITRAGERRSVLEGARAVSRGRSDSIETDATEKLALQMFAAREARNRFLPKNLDESAWDVLIAVYLDDLAGVRHTIGRFVELSQCSPTTALRRIGFLEENGLVTRDQDPDDRRIFHLIVTERGRKAVQQVLSFALKHQAP